MENKSKNPTSFLFFVFIYYKIDNIDLFSYQKCSRDKEKKKEEEKEGKKTSFNIKKI